MPAPQLTAEGVYARRKINQTANNKPRVDWRGDLYLRVVKIFLHDIIRNLLAGIAEARHNTRALAQETRQAYRHQGLGRKHNRTETDCDLPVSSAGRMSRIFLQVSGGRI